ncbi:MAG: hypothetical protein HC897_13895 [Thermoanaerobaculia bacterium]|nr:hypothetical protein [Thermoanaerobaculia bacterium]
MAASKNLSTEPSNDNKVVLLLDTTALMPMAAVQPALGAFINLLQLGDQFAILGYKGRVARVYPASGLATYDERQVLTDATLALDALMPVTRLASRKPPACATAAKIRTSSRLTGIVRFSARPVPMIPLFRTANASVEST